MITVHGYVPAWGLPDISPYVTKVVNYMTMAGIPFEWKAQDLDALSTFLGDKPFFLGEEPTSFDATIYSTFRHIADVPWDWAGRDHARSKTNLVAYADRMRNRFDV